MVRLLNQADWGEDRGRIQRLKGWVYYPLLLEAYDTLQEEALFPSASTARPTSTGCFSSRPWCAEGEGCGGRGMVRQVFRAASYHDVGRTFDGYDVDHGARSALRLAELTGQTGEALRELQAAVTAHARPDREMEAVVASFHPQNLPPGPGTHPPAEGRGQPGPGAPGRSGPPVPPAQQCQSPYRLCRTPLPALSRGGERRAAQGDQRTKNLGK